MDCAADAGTAEIIKKKEPVCPVVGRGRSAGVQERPGKACLCQGHVGTEAQAEGRLPGPTAGLWAHSGDGCVRSPAIKGEVAGGMSRSIVETDDRDLTGQERTWAFAQGWDRAGRLWAEDPVTLFAF